MGVQNSRFDRPTGNKPQEAQTTDNVRVEDKPLDPGGLNATDAENIARMDRNKRTELAREIFDSMNFKWIGIYDANDLLGLPIAIIRADKTFRLEQAIQASFTGESVTQRISSAPVDINVPVSEDFRQSPDATSAPLQQSGKNPFGESTLHLDHPMSNKTATA